MRIRRFFAGLVATFTRIVGTLLVIALAIAIGIWLVVSVVNFTPVVGGWIAYAASQVKAPYVPPPPPAQQQPGQPADPQPAPGGPAQPAPVPAQPYTPDQARTQYSITIDVPLSQCPGESRCWSAIKRGANGEPIPFGLRNPTGHRVDGQLPDGSVGIPAGYSGLVMGATLRP